MSAVQLLRVSVHERIRAAAEDFLLQVEKGGETAHVPKLRALLSERLAAAAEEIVAVFEENMAEYEDRVEREIRRQKMLLDAVIKPKVRLYRTDFLQLVVNNGEVRPEQHQWSPLVDQEDPEPPHIKEEPSIKQEGEQLQGLEEADVKITLTPVAVKREADENEVRLHREADFLQLVVNNEEVPPEQHQWSPLVDQKDPEPPHIKEEQGGLLIKQEGEQLQGLEEADMKITLTPVAVKSEEDEKPQSSQSQTEENRADGGGPEPARNSSPCEHLPPGTEDSDDERMETREPQAGLNTSYSECGNRGDLNGCMETPTGAKLFSCAECGYRCNQKSTLKVHMRIHTGEKPFSCSECGKPFCRKSDLKMHMRIHTGEKPFGCSECGRRFSRTLSLKLHKQTHVGEKEFRCSECGKTFCVMARLKKHMMSHTGEKTFRHYLPKNVLTPVQPNCTYVIIQDRNWGPVTEKAVSSPQLIVPIHPTQKNQHSK